MKTFITTDNKHEITRISRWITVKTNYNVNKRNSLYEFSTDENGYTPDQSNYSPENGTYLDYFKFNGRTYALNQFIALGSVWCAGQPYEFIDTDGKSTFVSAVDFYGDLYSPYYIELDEYGEKVRVYEVERA
jgi:hypothetical protein